MNINPYQNISFYGKPINLFSNLIIKPLSETLTSASKKKLQEK
jgi:hypothetical protein